MKAKRRCIPNFEARSVMLFAALAFGTAMGAHAQTSAQTGQATFGGTSTQTPAQKSAPATATTLPATGANTANSNSVEAVAFGRADKDRDGKLNRAEAVQLPMVSHRFDQIDLNRDNFISRDEFDKGTKS